MRGSAVRRLRQEGALQRWRGVVMRNYHHLTSDETCERAYVDKQIDILEHKLGLSTSGVLATAADRPIGPEGSGS